MLGASLAARSFARAAVVAAACIVPTVLAASCSADPNGRADAPVAGSAARAHARAQREARRSALDGQGGRSPALETAAEVAPPAPSAAPPPPPPTVSTAEAVDAGDAIDASGADAGDAAAADASVVEPPLCEALCDRVLACAQEMMPPLPPGIPGPDDLFDELRAGCLDECGKELEGGEASRRAEARRCLAEPDCESFVKCVEALRP